MWKYVEISELIFLGDSLSTKFQEIDEFSNEYFELTPIPFILLPTVGDNCTWILWVLQVQNSVFFITKKLTKQTKVEYQ